MMEGIVQTDNQIDNLEKSMEFFKNTFCRNMHCYNENGYQFIKPETTGNYEMYSKTDDYLEHVNITIMVENIMDAILHINLNGGKVITDITKLPGIGSFIYFMDPEGNIIRALEGV